MGIALPIIQIILGVALMVVGYLLMPKPKTTKAEAVKDLEAPTADASRPIPVVFGRIIVKSPNFIFVGAPTRRQGSG